jgi:hypothetical protein
MTMKKEQIRELFSRFEQAAAEVEGIECWAAPRATVPAWIQQVGKLRKGR